MSRDSVRLPAASSSIVVTTSVSDASKSIPFKPRKANSVRKAVRLLPSANGWFFAIP